MSYVDNLTSDQAQQQAKDIRATISSLDLSNINNFFKLLISKLDILTYTDLVDSTNSRNRYEMARLVRKRNGIWKAISTLNTGYPDVAEFFKYFSETDDELIHTINLAQSVMDSVNGIYLSMKYRSKENTYIQESTAAIISDEQDIRDELESFRVYFLEKL